MLQVESVEKVYPNGVRALGGVDLVVAAGEIVAVIGGSGCGKSTLLRLAAGLDAPSAGRVTVDGTLIVAPHPAVGLVFQEPRLLPWLTVGRNVAFGLGHLPAAERDRRITAALTRVGLADYVDRWPRELSGGQAQRVALARSLVPRPSVLLLDEPFSALDAFTRASLQDHLLDLWADFEPTMVLVTHDVEEALVLADRVVVMQPRPGRIAAIVPVELPRPRDRLSPELESLKRRVLTALDHSIVDRLQGEHLAPAAAI